MTRPFDTLRGSLCAAGVGGVLMATVTSVPALADTRIGADVKTSVGVATNPFNSLPQAGSSTTSGVASVGIGPWVRIEGSKTVLEASGDFSFDKYFKRYGNDLSGQVRALASYTLSDRVILRAGGSYQNSRAARRGWLLINGTPDQPPNPGEPLPDPVAVGRGSRSEGYSAFAGARIQLSARDDLVLNAANNGWNIKEQFPTRYNTISGNGTYSRIFSDRTTGNVSLAYSKVNYLNRADGDGTVFSPQLGIMHKFANAISLSASGGVSLVKSRQADRTYRKTTAFTGSLSACRTGGQSTVCANGSIASQPTGQGEIRSVKVFGVNYSNVLSERERISATARYGDTGGRVREGVATSKFGGISASYDRRIAQNLSIYVSPSVSKVFQPIFPRKTDFSIDVGLRLSIGAAR